MSYLFIIHFSLFFAQNHNLGAVLAGKSNHFIIIEGLEVP